MTKFRNRKDPNRGNAALASAIDSADIPALIATLAGNDGLARQRAREALVNIGKPAVVPLMKALEAPKSDFDLRWEAAKALSELEDPAAAPALIKTLEEDSSFSVRWLAAEGLIALGGDGLPPLLEALVKRSNSASLREGAHHVLRMLNEGDLRSQIAPVLAALEDVEPILEVPVAAHVALDALEEANAGPAG
jgi:HEAT repeat protein